MICRVRPVLASVTAGVAIVAVPLGAERAVPYPRIRKQLPAADMFELEGIDHVAIAVRDVQRSVDWYQTTLGLVRRHAEAWGDYPAVVGAGTTAIALFPVEGQTPQGPPGRHVLAMRHVAFRTDAENFARAQRELAARGIPLEFQDHQIARSIYLRDPDGHQIEITTYQLARGERQ